MIALLAVIAGCSIACLLAVLTYRRRYLVAQRDQAYLAAPGTGTARAPEKGLRNRLQGKGAKRRARSRQIANALPLIAEMLRGGSSSETAFSTVAACIGSPLGPELSRASREVAAASRTLDQALEALARRTKDADLELLASAVAVQKDGGGNLADVLESIAATVQKRLEMAGHIDAITSSARLSAALVGAMPPALLFLLSAASPAYMADFWASSIWPAILTLVAALDALGLAIIRRLYRLDLS